ncbi:MAG: bile acid:sodium symporter family protein [Bacillota bacterium]|nr:bile acid:sodium symporter family protein [Bacillota bacterium]
MNFLIRLSKTLSSNIGIIVILLSIVAFFFPPIFTWASPYTTYLLGVAMFGMGLTIRANDFKTVFKHPKYIAIGCIAQFIIMPFTAFLLAKLFQLPADLAIGVILVGCCPGGTASNVITHIAKGDTALSVSMTIVSTLLAPLVTPGLVYLLGGTWVEVPFWSMVVSTVQMVLVPVLLGIVIHEVFRDTVEKVIDIMPLISVIAIVLLICSIVGKNASALMTCGLLVVVVVILHNLCGLFLGLGTAKALRLDTPKATAVSVEVAMQNSGLAVSLAAANFAINPLATVPGAIFSVWHNISGSLFASYMKKKNETIK